MDIGLFTCKVRNFLAAAKVKAMATDGYGLIA
jgi:hypothetical protein